MDRAGVVPQLLGAAVGIVLGSALLFALLGWIRDDDPTPEVVADGSATEQVEEPTGDDPSPAAESTETSSEEPEPEASAEPEPDPEETTSEEPEPEPSPVTATEEVDPAEVSIQVLDAIGGEGGSAAAQAVADELREAGYNVVVVNKAGRSYETTTVFWSEGQEAGGRQVAAELGTSEAERTPAEVQLSNSVDVHVVVGADRA